jgi:Rab GDP dissociation inhibitor
MALYTNDDFLEKKAITTIDKMQLYFNSFGRYGNSPFIYPVWGLSGLAEGFSRLCALYGGTYMLNRDIEEILYDENGNFRGIKSQGEEAYGKILITEPSYVQKWNKVKSVGKVIRRICILDHPIAKTGDVPSCQIILPQKQIKRKNDIFIAVLNYTHCVCKKGYYLAIISTMVETDNPTQEIQPAMEIVEPVLETFDKVSDIYHPIDTSFKGNIYITSSFDPQSHFENDTDNVIDIYEKITGAKLDLNLEEEGEAK